MYLPHINQMIIMIYRTFCVFCLRAKMCRILCVTTANSCISIDIVIEFVSASMRNKSDKRLSQKDRYFEWKKQSSKWCLVEMLLKRPNVKRYEMEFDHEALDRSVFILFQTFFLSVFFFFFVVVASAWCFCVVETLSLFPIRCFPLFSFNKIYNVT